MAHSTLSLEPNSDLAHHFSVESAKSDQRRHRIWNFSMRLA
jgi:hypothetical protein